MYRGEFLKCFYAPEPGHCSLSSPKGLMGVFRSVIQPTPGFLTCFVTNNYHCGTIRAQFIRHDHLRLAKVLHCFPEKIQFCPAFPTLRDIGFLHLTFVIHRTPEIVIFAVYLHENLIKMPMLIQVEAHLFDPLSTDLKRKHWPKSVPPKPDRFVAHVIPALVQKIFDIAQRKRKPHIHLHREANDLRRRFEIAKGIGFCHL
jgi:hypothetical protein